MVKQFFFYMVAKGGSVELPTTDIDRIFKSVLKVGLESQKRLRVNMVL